MRETGLMLACLFFGFAVGALGMWQVGYNSGHRECIESFKSDLGVN